MAASASAHLVGDLPIPRTRLIGREDERVTARTFLLDEAVPLLTLTGPGGVGKTRLALAIATDMVSHFVDGIVCVDLAIITDPTLVPGAVGSALALFPAPDRPVVDTLVRHLHTRQTLLLLDNCEHLLTATADLLGKLLPRCPAVQVLATSRASLRVRGEQELPVDPLPLPSESQRDVQEQAQSAAVRLFAERARSVRPDFQVNEGNVAAVVTLCRRLDGLPLAIELAAAQTKLLPPTALLSRLDDRLSFLTGGAHDLPARQKTMRETIAWSHDLLTDAERCLFRRLGVFVGGWTLEAAEATVDLDCAVDVLSSMAALLDKNLVHRVDLAEDGAPPRFAMLETVREFAWEQLAASREEETLRDRHASWCLAEAERGTADPWVEQSRDWLRRMEREQANLRAAFDWLEGRAEGALALRLATAVAPYAWLRGSLIEGTDQLTRALTLADDCSPDVRARALWCLGNNAWGRADLPAIAPVAEQALGLFRELGDLSGVVRSLLMLAGAACDQGDLERGRALAEEALVLCPTDRPPRDYALNLLGTIDYLQDDDQRASAVLDEGIRLAREWNDAWELAYAVEVRACVAQRQGELARAAGLYRETFVILRQLYIRADFARGLERVASLAAMTGQIEQAARCLGAAEALREQTGRAHEPPLRLAYDDLLAMVRAALGDEPFAAAWTAGRVLPEAVAIAEAEAFLATVEARAPLNLGQAVPFPVVLQREPGVQPSRLQGATPTAVDAARSATTGTLTYREQDVLTLLGQRLTDAEIAAQLSISPRTVSSHVSSLLAKLGAANRREAAALAVRGGLL